MSNRKIARSLNQYRSSVANYLRRAVDDILDRLIHSAYKINLRGESMCKRKTLLTAPVGSG